MKKYVSFCLALLLIFCFSSIAYADNELSSFASSSGRYAEIASMFFTKQYTLYGKTGNDITSDVYDEITPLYESGRYEAVIEYLFQNIGYAEHITTETLPSTSGLNSSSDTIRVTRDFYQVVDDQEHGFQNHNAIFGTVVLTYVVNSNQGEIIRASLPNVTARDLFHYYGDLEPRMSVSGRSASISSDNQSVTFSFTVSGTLEVQSEDIAPEINAFNLAYSYSADFSFTEYAE